MEERKQSSYVKLNKDQVPLEDITPGELNQPIEVPQVRFQIPSSPFESFVSSTYIILHSFFLFLGLCYFRPKGGGGG